MADGLDYDIEAPDLRKLFTELKEIEPRLATGLRRALRQSGDDVIAEQRAILSGSKPGSVSVSGKKLRRIVPKNGRAPYLAFRKEYEYGAEKTGGVSNLRAQIADGLRTRVVTGQRRQSVQIKTTGPRNAGYNMAKVWQKPLFRHPAFGRGWVDQQGQPYFFGPIYKQQDAMRARIQDEIENVIGRIG